MTLVHIVLFKFKPEVTQETRDAFKRDVQALADLPGVKNGRPLLGGPSLTNPAELSKGLEYAFLSYHENLAALDEYSATKEYHHLTTTYIFPNMGAGGDLTRFDFEVDAEDEYMCKF